MSMQNLINKYNLRQNAELSTTNWFRVGGRAEFLFRPENAEGLASFLAELPVEITVTVLGVGSNIIIRDGGIDGVVIKLGRGFTELSVVGCQLSVGAAVLDLNLANFVAENSIAGLEFLSGIPGTIGGAVKMNAGAYDSDISQVLVSAEIVTRAGEIKILSNAHYRHCEEAKASEAIHNNNKDWIASPSARNDSIVFSYRHSNLADGAIVTKAVLQGRAGDKAETIAKIAKIKQSREDTQPIRSRTGGSTFKNPDGHKAWELIDKSGCRGLTIGGAQVSEKHCNFLINTGTATAADLENLGEEVRQKVFNKTGIMLEWEIKRIGKL